MPAWLVAYDINISTKEGRRRARLVRSKCRQYGEYLQDSLYITALDRVQAGELWQRLKSIIDPGTDKIDLLRLSPAEEIKFQLKFIDSLVI